MDVILRTSRLIFTLKAQYKNIMPFLRGKWTNADNQWTFEGQNQFHMIWVYQSRKVDYFLTKVDFDFTEVDSSSLNFILM